MPGNGRFLIIHCVGVFANNCVYQGVTGWDSFEPAVTKAEEMSCDKIWKCAENIPEEWYQEDRDGMHRLVDELSRRRFLIRRLISIFRESARSPFPNRRDVSSFVGFSSVGQEEDVEIR